jgi:hypothetical protein
MKLDDVIDRIMFSIAADHLSPFPGFFTFATILRLVASEWEGKGREDRFGQRGLSSRQIAYIRGYLDGHYDRRRGSRGTYYGRDKRR